MTEPLFTEDFLTDAGMGSVRLPPRSPNLNSYAERFVRSIKNLVLERITLFGDSSLEQFGNLSSNTTRNETPGASETSSLFLIAVSPPPTDRLPAEAVAADC
ncbi:MAG: putative transposase [Bryobacterales bacterium]|jgi:uncharacterized protein (UPF0128 family)|nr:putative transposase [Bryobacterales bacterium]